MALFKGNWAKKTCTGVFSLVLATSMVPFAYAEEPDEPNQVEATGLPDADYEQAGEYASAITDEDVAESLAALGGEPSAAFSLSRSKGNNGVDLFSGADRFETTALQTTFGWSDGSSEWVIIAGSEGWPDALTASSLAGALGCPILLSPQSTLNASTADAIAKIGATKAIIVGGDQVVGGQVVDDLKSQGVQMVERIAGPDRYSTQLAIYQYGIDHRFWDSSTRIAAAAAYNFADALSFSPVAYKAKIPIFLTTEVGGFSEAQQHVLASMSATAPNLLTESALLLGGTTCVSAETELYLSGLSGSTTRLGGVDRYETSALIAAWGVGNAGLSWSGAAFTTGLVPYDALGGGALQGKLGSVLLLTDGISTDVGLNAMVASGQSIDNIKFFGSYNAVSKDVRDQILSAVGMSYTFNTDYAITLSDMAKIEYEVTKPYYKDDELTLAGMYWVLDPWSYTSGTASYLQFAVLSDGYSGMTAAQMDEFIDSKVRYQESNYGVTSNLRGTGAYFVAAAQKYNINEVYLLAHAAIESAWGCSALAQGTVKGYSGYMNFYGIGAYDIDPLNGGAALAKSKNWTTPERAIEGAAEWIAKNYVHPTVGSAKVSGQQNTLYKMKWDVQRAVSEGSVWHQYATSYTWHTGIASVMSNFYSYNGISLDKTGLRFDVPRYQ